jgi:hypothetical protein
MTFDLHGQHRWLAMLAVAGLILIGAGATGHITLASFAAGMVAWACGELAHYQHGSAGPSADLQRVASGLGVALNLFGLTLVALAFYRFWKYGYWPVSEIL